MKNTMKNKKILVVDDDAIVLNSCKRILEAESCTVILASSAQDAMEKLEHAGVFDMMIMDVKMPERDGVYLLGKITERWPLEKWPELPVLVMSGYPTPDTKLSLLDRGVREFIPKPFTPDELIEAVDRVLHKRSGRANRK
jgi:DNA-binding NtrC family response regulator